MIAWAANFGVEIDEDVNVRRFDLHHLGIHRWRCQFIGQFLRYLFRWV